jgi:tetratricopeptide (TPR) repeat protein
MELATSTASRFRRARRGGLGLAVIAWVLSSPISIGLSSAPLARAAEQAPPSQEDREQAARRHFAQGDAAFKAGRYDAALSEFEAGYAASPRPGFLLNMAHTARKLGDLRKARSLYKKYLLTDPTSKLREDVLGVIAELDSALADEDRADANRTATAENERSHEPAAGETAERQHPAPPPRAPPPPVAAPVLVTQQAQAPSAEQAGEARPFYARAWFWATVGVVVAAGAGVAIYAAQRSSSDPFHSTGSLGTLGP